jgi:phosphate transport system permease protein
MPATVAPENDPLSAGRTAGTTSVVDLLFGGICHVAAASILALAVLLLVVLVVEAAPFVRSEGLRALAQIPWNPGGATPTYGGAALIYGTLVTSTIALLFAVPFGVGAAVFLAEIALRPVRLVGAFLVELLAAIPSVVYGLWGLVVLAPLVGGPGILAAGLVLAIMIVPYVTAISYAVCRAAPRSQCDAALALGATRWQMIRTIILPHARRGIAAAIFLALGRALGETMAVTMLIGNKALAIESPIGGVGDSVASVIASQLNEATTQTQRSGLVALALVLFLVTLFVNILGRKLIRRAGRPMATRALRTHVTTSSAQSSSAIPVAADGSAAMRANSAMTVALSASFIATLVPLFLILGFIVVRGASGISIAFFTELPAPPGQPGGGLAHALVGSARLVALAAIVAMPLGLLAAIALAEFRTSRFGSAVRFVGELLGGVPSIIIGIFGYAVIVNAFDPPRFSAWAGSFALGVMMLPIVLRASEEALRAVPAGLRHASSALGAAQWQTIVRVVLPAALPGITTGAVLAIARIAGETAPLLLTAYGSSFFARSFDDPTPFLPKYIYNYATSGFAYQEQQAWTAALVLLAIVVVLNLSIRLVASRSAARAELAV